MDSEELENFVCYAEGDDDVPRTADCECNLGVVGRVSPGIGKCELLKVRYRARSPCFPFCWPLASKKNGVDGHVVDCVCLCHGTPQS